MSFDLDPVCRPEPEAGFDRLYSPFNPDPQELLCRAEETSPSEAKSFFENSVNWGKSQGQYASSRFASEIFKSNPFQKPEPKGPWSMSLGGLVTSAMGGLVGCSTPAESRPSSVLPQGALLMSGDFRGRNDLLGDPEKYGTILFFRQSYGSMPDMDSNLDSLDAFEDTLQYQWHILKALELHRPKHVFVEDLPIDFPAGDRAPLMKYVKDGLGDFKNFFSKYDLPSEREPRYLRLLAAFKQVALIYAYKYPDVHLHRTIEAAETAELHVRLEQLRVRHQGNPSAIRQDPEFRKLMFELPEAYAVREMMKFYKDHPGEMVALLFGKMNQFCDNFQDIHYLPRIASIWWSEPTDSMTIPKACE